MASPFQVVRGTAHALFAYDVAWAVDLDKAQRLLNVATELSIKRRPRASQYLGFRPPPLRIAQEAPPLAIGGLATHPQVELLLYGFGAVSVGYRLALDGAPFERLLELSDALYDNAELLADSRQRVEALVRVLGPALERPGVAAAVEDYVIYGVESWAPASTDVNWPARDQDLARILRCERDLLSAQEAADAVSHSISYKPGDLALVDWNAAILFGPDTEDTRAVLEFANVALLESRTLDGHLDQALDLAYDRATPKPERFRLPGLYRKESFEIAQIQVESAVLFESVNNTLKLLGDEYLARAYRLAAERFNLAQWEAAILRKLETLDSIYGKMSDRAASIRLEVLEWVIIVLIAISIAIPFVTGH